LFLNEQPGGTLRFAAWSLLDPLLLADVAGDG
jgi:hypothetical protein